MFQDLLLQLVAKFDPECFRTQVVFAARTTYFVLRCRVAGGQSQGAVAVGRTVRELHMRSYLAREHAVELVRSTYL